MCMLENRADHAGANSIRQSRTAWRPVLNLLGILLLSAVSQFAYAACTKTSTGVWTSSVDYSSLSSCVTQAASGDTINVTSGTATYTTGITISKPLTIIGAKDGSTVINGSNATVITINMSAGGNVQISYIKFTGTGGSTQLETTMINMRGVLDHVRMDHLTFENIPEHSVYIGLWDMIPVHPKVLFDHITYTNNLTSGWGRFLKLLGNNNTWNLDDGYGTDNFVFIEDSSFTWTGTANTNAGVTDTEHGARLVVRNNIIKGGGVQVHDTGSTPAAKGQRATEVYGNTFTCTISGCSNIPAVGVRGGGWLIYNNNFDSGFWVPAYPQVYRATVTPGYIGASCNGTPVPACNTPTFYHCSGGDHAPCGYSGDSVCSGKGSCVIAASSAADCPTGYAFLANIDRADGGSGASGYPCRHQTGWGKELNGGQTEQPSPVYVWNNKLNGAAFTFNYDVSPWFLKDRDYCNHDPSSTCGGRAAWTYTPYTYPHPWQSGGEPSIQPPPNVQVQ